MPCDDCSRAEICPPCVNGEPMTTAREDLLAMFPIGGLDERNRAIVEAGVDLILAKHAHELAERQRAWAREENFVLPVEVDGRDVPLIAQQTAQILASLIDPKAQT